ncbi:hypothetical protein [Listeria valentina]|uniref:hypothetical protein n=1 Tax=Listeria valentina TaxID=2705293 RepID=UPI001431B2DF|nr:hypothetical protein [Listeria valentina]
MNRRYLNRQLNVLKEIEAIEKDVQTQMKTLKRKMKQHLDEHPNGSNRINKFKNYVLSIEQYQSIFGLIYMEIYLNND